MGKHNDELSNMQADAYTSTSMCVSSVSLAVKKLIIRKKAPKQIYNFDIFVVDVSKLCF